MLSFPIVHSSRRVVEMSSDDTDRGVPPENYELWDDEREQYRCPVCDSRVLRIGEYAECTDCGRSFYRSQDTDMQQTDGGLGE